MSNAARRLAKLSILFCSALLVTCAAQTELPGRWSSGEQVMDGLDAEWLGHYLMPSDQALGIAASNDGEFLYVGMKVRNPDIIRQAGLRGFTLWLDKDGGTRQRLGIRFAGLRSLLPRMSAQGGIDMESMRFALAEALTGPLPLQMIDAHEEEIPFIVSASAVSEVSQGEWFCEFKIPLILLGSGRTTPESVGVGFKSNTLDPSNMPSRQGGRGGAIGAGPGGRGGMPGGGRPSGGPPGGGMRADADIEYWFKVKLINQQ